MISLLNEAENMSNFFLSYLLLLGNFLIILGYVFSVHQVYLSRIYLYLVLQVQNVAVCMVDNGFIEGHEIRQCL